MHYLFNDQLAPDKNTLSAHWRRAEQLLASMLYSAPVGCVRRWTWEAGSRPSYLRLRAVQVRRRRCLACVIEFPRISALPRDLAVASRDLECGSDDGFITSDTCFISPICVVMFVSNGARTRVLAVGKSVTVSAV